LLILIFTLGFISVSSLNAAGLATKLKGKILLQVEKNGEAWYVSPKNEKRYFMGRPNDAFTLMREQGVGITNSNLYKIPVGIITEGYQDADNDSLPDYLEDALGLNKNSPDTDKDGYNDNIELANGYSPWDSGKQPIDNNFAKAQAGKIFLQVEKNGEAWYINPDDNKRYFLGRPNDAFNIMRNLGLGITDSNLSQIMSSDGAGIEPELGEVDTSFDEEWNVYQNFLSAVKNQNLDKANSLLYSNINNIFIDMDWCLEQASEDECWSMIDEFSGANSKTTKRDFVNVEKDKKQTVISGVPYFDESKDTQLNMESAGKIYFIKDSGKIKILKIYIPEILHIFINPSDTSFTSEQIAEEKNNFNNYKIDSDRDGYVDMLEKCLQPWGEVLSSNYNCTQTNPSKKDTDGDGWWDSVEVEADSDPNNKEDKLNFENEEITNEDTCSSCGEYEIPDCGNGILKYQGMDKCGCPIPPICEEKPIDDEEDDNNSMPASFNSCTKDSDCTVVNLDCCGCNAGGMATVINPYYLDAWNQTVLVGCEGYSCTAVMSQHISCFSEAKCVSGTCTLNPNPGEICASDLYSNCQGVEGDELEQTKDEYGASCQEIIDICE